MYELSISVTETLGQISPGANFVVFANKDRFIPEERAKQYIKNCAAYAKHYDCYLVTNLVALFNYLCLFMFGPGGKVVGLQRAIHLNRDLAGKFERIDSVSLAETKFGKVFLCVDCDIYHPEVTRLAKLEGADIIVASQHIPLCDYTDQRLITGAWNAAQQNGALVICTTNESSCVCVPYSLTPDGSGFLSDIAHPVYTATKISEEIMEEIHRPLDTEKFNKILYQNYVIDLER